MAFVYKLSNDLTDEFYIGSTKNLLCKRLATHNYNAKKGNMSKLYECMRNTKANGAKWKIEKLLDVVDPCLRFNEEETYRICLKPTLNTKCANTGIKSKGNQYKKEYYQNNKNKYKDYYINNRDKILERAKNKYINQIYYLKNKDKLKNKQKDRYWKTHTPHVCISHDKDHYNKQYYIKNKDKIKEMTNKYYWDNKKKIPIIFKDNIKISFD